MCALFTFLRLLHLRTRMFVEKCSCLTTTCLATFDNGVLYQSAKNVHVGHICRQQCNETTCLNCFSCLYFAQCCSLKMILCLEHNIRSIAV